MDLEDKYKISLRKRIRYQFDNLISKGAPAMIGMLFAIFLITALFTAFLLLALGIKEIGGRPMSIFEAYWTSLMHVIDQGTLTGDDEWEIRLVMLGTTFIGIFLVSSLVSILNTGFSVKIEELRKGRSLVVEESHTVILGWSSKIFSIISELKIANENQHDSCIVILADKEIDFMKDEISHKVGRTGKLRVVFRHGSPRDAKDIMIANLNTAKSIIILSPEDKKSDTYAIKTILAIVNNPKRKQGKYNIIAEIKNESNREIAKIVGKDEVTVVVSNEIIAKITVQTSRQSGLSIIYNDIIDYKNVEIYILPVKNLRGHTFRECVFAFDKMVPIGIRNANGDIIINPGYDTVFGTDDKMVLIAEDDIEFEFVHNPKYIKRAIPEDKVRKPSFSKNVQKTLILGWNQNSVIVIRELDKYVSGGSEVFVIAENENLEELILNLNKDLVHQSVKFRIGDINNRSELNKVNFDYFDYVIILSYSDRYGIQEADAITLITLMHIRDIASKMNKSFNVVSEMLDMKNRELALISKSDDFIISDQIISLVLAQLSENNELSFVFEELFDAAGNEIYLRPIIGYVDPGVQTDFYHISEIALAKGEIAIGYRQLKHLFSQEKNYGVVLNPCKSDLVSFDDGDKIIVVAEN